MVYKFQVLFFITKNQYLGFYTKKFCATLQQVGL